MKFLNIYQEGNTYYVERPVNSKRAIILENGKPKKRPDGFFEDGTYHGDQIDSHQSHAAIYRCEESCNMDELVKEEISFWGIIPKSSFDEHHVCENNSDGCHLKEFYAVAIEDDFDGQIFYASKDGKPKIDIFLGGHPVDSD